MPPVSASKGVKRYSVRAPSAFNILGVLDDCYNNIMPKDPGTTILLSSKPMDRNNLYEIMKLIRKSVILIIQKTAVSLHCSMKK